MDNENEKKLKNALKEVALKLSKKAITNIKKRHTRAGQKATGKTSALLEAKKTRDGCNIYGWKYIDTYEVGRSPGRMPDIDKIREWVSAKHLDFNKTPDQVEHYVYCIAYKIAREGTERFRSPKKPDIYTTPFNKLADELAEQCSGELVASITNLFKPDPKRDA